MHILRREEAMSQKQKNQEVIQKTSCVYPLEGAYTLKSFLEDDSEEEPVTFVKIKPGVRERARTRAHVQAKPTRKSSYESSVDVQRWLREQAYEERPSSPAFNPTLLASRRDASWILSSLTPFYNQHLITDVLHEAHSTSKSRNLIKPALVDNLLDLRQ